MKVKNYSTAGMVKLATHKNLLKEYLTEESSRTVYMNDGDEFEIQLFNPTTDTVAAEIEINGKSISDSMIVIEPGQRIWLERFLDEAVRFRFSTYEVDGGDADVKKAIMNNGDVTVKFYKEREKVYARPTITTSPNDWYDNITTYPNSGTPKPNIYYSQCCGDISYSSCGNATLLTSDYNHTFGATEAAASTLSAAELNDWNDCKLTTSCVANELRPKTMETGRIDKGSYSTQKFRNVNKEFEMFPFETARMKILPMSRKNVSASDLKKIYCTNCGRKLNSKFKFCPYCGEKIIN